MLQDMLSSKLVRAGLISCLLLIAGSLLYRRHVVGAIRKDEARTKQFLREFEAKIAAAEKIDTDNAMQPATPTATYPIPENEEQNRLKHKKLDFRHTVWYPQFTPIR